MIITGEVKLVPKEKHECPADGVHRSANGIIRGAHMAYIGDNPVFYGLNGFYLKINDTTGIKVYYSLKLKKRTKKKEIRRIFNRMIKLRKKIDFIPKPLKIEKVFFNGKKIYGIIIEHCNYPEKAWMDYAKGLPYDWNCLPNEEHPNHNPEEFLIFRKIAKRFVKKYKIDSKAKLGDVVYDTIKKQWLLVDVD